ncbi:MAG: hypothetical protein A2Z17_06990 [Gammaproteobacteria bacterium RBG_16_66_13]|nr:MAG: hypothetical protein A2Z17_06990 [Gammaproteobacteria bacterium RBG_16_66_13]
MDSEGRTAAEPERDSSSGAPTARWLAGLVLVPAVPLLLASVLALAAFYAAPERFGAWLSKLPGDTYLRTAMIFAPASLMAVVVLSTLYLRDSAGQEDPSAHISGGLGRLARLSLVVTGPLLTLIGALAAARYLDAERVERWLEDLPGTRYVIQALDLAPLALLLAVGVAILIGYAPGGRPTALWLPQRRWPRARVGRVAAGVVLTLATPALLLSLLGLVLQVVAPDRFARFLEPLPGDTYLRLLLMLAPTGLLAILLLALLYLLGPLDPHRTQPVRAQPFEVSPRRAPTYGQVAPRQSASAALSPPRPAPSPTLRSDLAIVVLVVGMILAVAAGALLVGGMLVLLLVQ